MRVGERMGGGGGRDREENMEEKREGKERGEGKDERVKKGRKI